MCKMSQNLFQMKRRNCRNTKAIIHLKSANQNKKWIFDDAFGSSTLYLPRLVYNVCQVQSAPRAGILVAASSTACCCWSAKFLL